MPNKSVKSFVENSMTEMEYILMESRAMLDKVYCQMRNGEEIDYDTLKKIERNTDLIDYNLKIFGLVRKRKTGKKNKLKQIMNRLERKRKKYCNLLNPL